MNYIDSLENLVELLQNSEDVIFVPGVNAGKSVLDWLEYSDNLDNVTCVAAIRGMYHLASAMDSFSTNNIPVLLLEYLPHYRENGVFIVAMNPNVHDEVYDDLIRFGCKNIFFLSVNAYNQIVEDLKKIMAPEQVMQRFMTRVIKKLDRLELVIEEQNEICAVNGAAFERYRNVFQGRKIVVVASGPTLNYYKPVNDAIHIGINFAWKNENIPLDFLFTMDRYTNKGEAVIAEMERGFERIKERIFIGKRLQKIGAMVRHNYPADISLRRNDVSFFYLDYAESPNSCGQQMYQDICHHPIAFFRSTVFSAINFALFTNPAELYLVGCDVTHSGHFYSTESNKDLRLKPLMIGYARIKNFAEQHYPETKIISINPVNLKGLFTDVYTDEYKKSLENA